MTTRKALTVNFMDGTKIAFDFPEMSSNVQVKHIRLEEFFKSSFFIIEAEGTLMVYPVANIKSLEMPMSADEKQIKLPPHAIRGAQVVAD